jgi:hypothetical protein
MTPRPNSTAAPVETSRGLSGTAADEAPCAQAETLA